MRRPCLKGKSTYLAPRLDILRRLELRAVQLSYQFVVLAPVVQHACKCKPA